MKNNNNFKIFFLIFCIVMIFFCIYMEFIYKKSWNGNEEISELLTEQKEQEAMEIESIYDYSNRELPDINNESGDEIYSEGMNIEIYFENTDVIDHGGLPLEVQSEMAKYTQRYLYQNGYSDVTELYIDEKSYEEGTEKITFNCYMDGYREVLCIEYIISENRLRFSIIES